MARGMKHTCLEVLKKSTPQKQTTIFLGGEFKSLDETSKKLAPWNHDIKQHICGRDSMVWLKGLVETYNLQQSDHVSQTNNHSGGSLPFPKKSPLIQQPPSVTAVTAHQIPNSWNVWIDKEHVWMSSRRAIVFIARAQLLVGATPRDSQLLHCFLLHPDRGAIWGLGPTPEWIPKWRGRFRV